MRVGVGKGRGKVQGRGECRFTEGVRVGVGKGRG